MKKRVKTSRELRLALKGGKKLTEKKFGDLLREVSFKAFRDAQVFTPKDTGWASQHWSIGINRSTETESIIYDSFGSIKAGDAVKIFNNVAYILRLDQGHSSQRPSGFMNDIKRRAGTNAKSLSLKLSKEVLDV